jgi:hypothetical protein
MIRKPDMDTVRGHAAGDSPLASDRASALEVRNAIIQQDARFQAALARERPRTGPSQQPGTDYPRPLRPADTAGAASAMGWL